MAHKELRLNLDYMAETYGFDILTEARIEPRVDKKTLETVGTSLVLIGERRDRGH